MINPIVSNPNDFKVVQFTNKTDFEFTPDMGCMFDSRPIFGISGGNGIKSGDTMTLPYHIGNRLAVNLAKAVMTRRAPQIDPTGVPTGVPLWDDVALEKLKNTFVSDLYTEAKPIAETEVDRLMKKVEELNKLVQDSIVQKVEPSQTVETKQQPVIVLEGTTPAKYQDKQEVVAELTKRNIVFDARASKDNLEKLLA